MHSIVFEELKGFVEKTLGDGSWNSLLDKAGMSGASFDKIGAYPDEDLLKLVQTGSELSGLPVPDLVEAFGAAIAPDLLSLVDALLKPEWKTLEVIENTEMALHAVIRLDKPGATPPKLRVERQGEELTMYYSSERKLCWLAKGIAKGMAQAFDEKIEIKEPQCMHDGADSCILKIRRI